MGLLLLIASLTDQSSLLKLEYPIYDQLLRFRVVPDNDQVVLIATDTHSPTTPDNHYRSNIDMMPIIAKVKQHGSANIALLTPPNADNIGFDVNSIASEILSTNQIIVAIKGIDQGNLTPQNLSKESHLHPVAPLTNPQQLLFNWQNPLANYRTNNQKKWSFSPTPLYSGHAITTGHLIFFPDSDGKIRSQPLLMPDKNNLIPSLALQLTNQARGDKLSHLQLISPQLEGILQTNKTAIPVISNYRTLFNAHPKQLPFQIHPSSDLLQDRLTHDQLKGKLVLIGPINSYGDRHQVAGYGNMSTSELAALATATLLADSPPQRPSWSWSLEATALLYFLATLLFLVPRLSFRAGIFTVILFLFCWIIVTAGSLIYFSIWLKSVPAIVLCLTGFTFVRWHIGNRERYHHQQENLRTLTQRFLEQGLLDLALEKALQIEPNGKTNKEQLYNLGIEFERKRMPHNAVSIYQHLLQGGRFKDTKTRIKQLLTFTKSETLTPNSGATIIANSGGIKPTLGRYKIESELGQGAMGTVYLGVDPKINRQVAIKTMAYQQVDAEDLAQTKTRFFREAEAAGNLNHPNIVTIYDVGEEADLAFFAMELLEGDNLSIFCQHKKLLPVAQVIAIISQTTTALDYAHNQGIIHRDIKPTNIVLTQGNQIKVVDFGIARITNSTSTETGIIIGTPSYMSPEQVAGKKVDGRSDLFSLGVVMYELLSGKKPFQGENLAALMHNISTVNYISLADVRPDLPPACYTIIDKLLQKTFTRRFKSAEALQQQLLPLQQSLEKK